MPHFKKEKFSKTKLCNGIDISNTTSLLSSEEWNKISNNPGVLKIIHYCPKRNNKADNCTRREGGNRNITRNTLNINTKITQAAIAVFHTSHTNDNIITVQVQMPHIVRQIVVNAFVTNNYVSVTGSGSSKRFSVQYKNHHQKPSFLFK